MAVRSRRPWVSVALGLVLGFTAASWLIAPRVAELSERKRRGSSRCFYYVPSPLALGHRSRFPEVTVPALPELQGSQLAQPVSGVTNFRSSSCQQATPPSSREDTSPKARRGSPVPGSGCGTQGELERLLAEE